MVIAKAALDTNNDKKLTDKKGIDVSQDDWLGLNDEYVADNWTQNEKQLSKHEGLYCFYSYLTFNHTIIILPFCYPNSNNGLYSAVFDYKMIYIYKFE